MPSLPIFLASLVLAASVAVSGPQSVPEPPRAPEASVTATAASEPVQAILEPPTTTTSTTTTQPPPPPTTTTTAPPPPPVVEPASSSTGDCGGYVPLLQKYWPGDQIAKACQVIGCETGYTYSPSERNPSSSASGLFQFLDGTWESTTGTPAPASNYSAETQIAAGAKLWRQSGWNPWSCA